MKSRRFTNFILFYLFIFVITNMSPALPQDIEDYFKMSIQELMNIEVTSATKTPKKIREAPSSIVSITAKEIEEMGARTLSDVLKMLPGIQIVNRRNGRDMVWIRGVTTGYNTKVLLRIDGIPQREAILGEWAPDEEVQINNIEHIEVIRGPGSALYGANAYAGVISIFTKKDTDITKASTTIGSFNMKRLQFYTGKSINDFKLILAGKVHETDGHQMIRDRKGKPTNHKDHVDAKNIQAKFIYKNILLSLTQNDFETDYPLYEIGRDKPQFYIMRTGLLDYNFNHEKFRLHPKFYLMETKRFFDNKTRDDTGKLLAANESHLESLIYGFDGQLTYKISDSNTFVSGISLEQKEAKKWYEEVILQYTDIDTLNHVLDNGETIKIPVDLYQLEEHYYFSWLDKNANINSKPTQINTANYAAYIQDEMRFIKNKLNLTLGLRYDEYEGFNSEFSPRFGFVINPNNKWTLKGLWGKAFKPPTYRQTYMIRVDGKSPGNPNVGPERITTFETEISYNMRQNVLIRANYFNNVLTDFIESINYATYSNSDDKRKISGFEMDAKAERTFNLSWLNSLMVFSSYSFVDATDQIGSQKVDVPSVAKHSVNWGFKLRNKYLTLYSGWNFIGKRNKSRTYHSSVIVNEYREKDNKKSYLIWDLNLGFNKISQLPIRFDLSIHNVMDTEHYNPTYDPDSYYDYTKESRSISLKITADL